MSDASPRPWRWVDSFGMLIANDRQVLAVHSESRPSEADAAYIVRAVNHHDEMVMALDRLATMGDCRQCYEGYAHSCLFEWARELLAKVKP